MKKTYFYLIILLITSLLIADFNEQAISEIFSDELLSERDIYQQLSRYNDFSEFAETGKIIEMSTKEGTPWYYYVPESYEPKQRHGLVVWLHGGVGREEFVEADEYIYEHPLLSYCEESGLLLLMPMSRFDCKWWESAGEQNIREELKYLKEKFNVDDDRVYMTGFSDGGSGSYHFAYRLPSEYAAFYPLNGMISVAAGETGKPCFIKNLANRYIHVVNTDEDGLYPAEMTRKTINLVQEEGIEISYREYWGFGHDWGYFPQELPLITKDMNKRYRDSFASSIYWETLSSSEYNRCDWLAVTKVDTLQTLKEWHRQPNVKLPDKQISFGFYHDPEFKGDGVFVKDIVPGTLAEEMHMLKNDIIIAMDGQVIATIDDLSKQKADKQRGDQVSLTVYRNEETLSLEGRFPDIAYYDAFFYQPASGAVKGRYYANIFEIETSRVSSIKLYISPEMVNMDIPVRVIINGKEVFNDLVKYDREVMQECILTNLDRKVIWINELEFEIE